jgi:patatin-like phospholipase/acyl hydrolase
VRALCIESSSSGAVIPAAILTEVERRTGRRIADLFDLIVGSSAGALLALMVTRPDATGRSRFSAAEAQHLIETELPKVVNDRPFLARHWSSNRARPLEWDESRFRALTDLVFGETPLAAAVTPVAVPLYELRNRQPLLFVSTPSGDDPRGKVSMAEIARGAMAMPPYSEPARVEDPVLRRFLTVVDGSIYATPALIAFRLALGSAVEQMLIVSISDGAAETPLDKVDWGGPSWSSAVFEIARDGQADFADHLLRGLLGADRYLPIKPASSEAKGSDADDRARDPGRMRSEARRLISERTSDLDALSAQLSSAVSAPT